MHACSRLASTGYRETPLQQRYRNRADRLLEAGDHGAFASELLDRPSKGVYTKEVIPKNYFSALAGLRFFLAIWVVLDHLTGPGMMLEAWAHTLPAAVYSVIRLGYLAVSVFFILSGFVLASSYGETVWARKSLSRYFVARTARIYPVYALSILVVSPYMAASKVPGKPLLIADYVLLLQGWTGTLLVQWNTPAWSLSCEMFFYLCFPLAAVAIVKLSPRAMLALSFAICLLPALLWSLGTPDRIKPLIHLADFLVGITAARSYVLLRPSLEGRGSWIYLPALAVLGTLLLHPVSFPGVLDLNGILRPFIALMLLGFALSGGLLDRVLSWHPFVFMGKAGYSLYILHIPLLWWFKRWSPHWFPGRDAMAACVYAAGALAISAIVYSFIEEPANRYLRNISKRSAPIRQQDHEFDLITACPRSPLAVPRY